MARVTIEDCLKVIDNAFDICVLAGKRAKDLSGGAEPLIDCKDKPTVIALREIAQEKIGMDYFEISNKQKIESQLFGNISEEEVIDELSQNLDQTPNVDTGEEPINNDNKILIIKEQGAGDEILYGSMYSDLINKFSDIKIETDPRLISLFERSLNKKNIFVPYAQYSKNSEKIKKFDKILYAGSLGRLFRNKLSDFPKNNYLFADEKKYTSMGIHSGVVPRSNWIR